MKKRYWLRGGIKGLVIGLILNIVAMFSAFFLMLLPPSLSFISAVILFLFPMTSFLWIVMPQTLVVPFMIYFTVGAIIGWHKGRNKSNEVIIN